MNTSISRSQRGCFFMFCLETSLNAFPNAHRRPCLFRHSVQRIPIRSPSFRTPSIKISSFVNVISSGSPFNAVEVLNDPAKQEEYMMSLKLRAKQCEIETKQVKDTITELLRGTIHG